MGAEVVLLGLFLEEAGSRKREPGIWDCCTMPAEWTMACGHPDPMAEWRGMYATEHEGERLMAEAGGLHQLYLRGFASIGLGLCRELWAEGDVGIVRVLGHEAGAVFTGKRWALVADRGLAFVSLDPADVTHVWRVCHG